MNFPTEAAHLSSKCRVDRLDKITWQIGDWWTTIKEVFSKALQFFLWSNQRVTRSQVLIQSYDIRWRVGILRGDSIRSVLRMWVGQPFTRIFWCIVPIGKWPTIHKEGQGVNIKFSIWTNFSRINMLLNALFENGNHTGHVNTARSFCWNLENQLKKGIPPST